MYMSSIFQAFLWLKSRIINIGIGMGNTVGIRETQSSACGVVYGRNCLTMGVPHLFGVWCPNLSTFPYSSSFLWKNATKVLIDSSLTFMPAACLSFAEENS